MIGIINEKTRQNGNWGASDKFELMKRRQKGRI
jgi:hypothetical protein